MTAGVVLVCAAQLEQISNAMRAAHYRRQPHRGRWRVVMWQPCNMYPQPMPNTPGDRHAMMRYATGLREIPNGGVISRSNWFWREIVMLLPPVPSLSEFDAADIRTAEESHARFDSFDPNLDLIGGGA